MPNDELLALLPAAWRSALERLPDDASAALEEIRIREDRPLEIGFDGRFAFVLPDGRLTDDYRQAYIPRRAECRAMLERITNHSLYAMEEELRQGYVTVKGGHRIGLAGRTVLERGTVRHLRDVAGYNIRIARARPGCAAGVLPALLDRQNRTIRHTLVLSAPQQGKTTLIRDLARCISAGEWRHPDAAGWRGRKVGIVDERSEIAACDRGVPTFDVGPRTDVLDACPKSEGLMMLVRSMSPEVVVVDEIGRPEDAAALREALHAGVRVIATAHAAGPADLFARPVLAELAAEGMFDAYVVLRRVSGQVRHRVLTAREAAGEYGRRSAAALRPGGAPRDAPGDDGLPGEAPSSSPTSAPAESSAAAARERPLPLIRSPAAAREPAGAPAGQGGRHG